MGEIIHDVVIATFGDYILGSAYDPGIEAWRRTLPLEWQALVVGPICSVINSDVTYFFAPDGSKTGWGDDALGDAYRNEFINLFGFHYFDGSTPFDVVHVTYGRDLRGAGVPAPLAGYVVTEEGEAVGL